MNLKKVNLETQRGIFLVLFSVVAVMLIAMLGLLIGSGFLASNKTLLQNASNNVAMAAIEGYSTTTAPNFFQRACISRTRAQRVMELNDVKGFSLNKASVMASDYKNKTALHNEPGVLEEQLNRCSDEANPDPQHASAHLTFGRWIEDRNGDVNYIPGNSTSGTEECKNGGSEAKYPCFIRTSSVTKDTQVSAVRVDLSSSSEPPIYMPFAGISPEVKAKSFAVVVPRCFAGVVDLSYSSVLSTHPVPRGDEVFGAKIRSVTNGYAPGRSREICGSCGELIPSNVFGACQAVAPWDQFSSTNPYEWIPINANPCDAADDDVCNDPVGNPPKCRCYADSVGRSVLAYEGYSDGASPPVANRKSFLNVGWKRPWIPWRMQQYYPVFNENLEPPYIGLPFLPLEYLMVPSDSPPVVDADWRYASDTNSNNIFYTHDNCKRNTGTNGAKQYFTAATWCNMWRGRDPDDGITPYRPYLGNADCGNNSQYLALQTAENSKLAHFWSDYDPYNYSASADIATPAQRNWLPKPEESPYGPLLVDKLISTPVGGKIDSYGPEPLSRYLSAMNSAFRLVNTQSSAGDRALVLGFAGDLMYKADNPYDNPTTTSDDHDPLQVALIPGKGMLNEFGATPDFALLAQITNPLARGVYYWSNGHYSNAAAGGFTTQDFAEYHPNFIDAGFVSRFVIPKSGEVSRVGGTNILKALLVARSGLLNSNNGAGCGPGSLKSIVLFTDGINTCAPRRDQLGFSGSSSDTDNWWFNKLQKATGPAETPHQPDLFICDNGNNSTQRYADFYQRYELFLTGDGEGPVPAGQPKNVLQALQQDRISFNAVVDGQALGAQWNRIKKPNTTDEYYSIGELRGAGGDVRSALFDFKSIDRSSGAEVTQDQAYLKSDSSVYFRKPLETLGILAFETGGMLWPILPRCVANPASGPSDCPLCTGNSCYKTDSPGSEVKDCAWGGSTVNKLKCSPLNLSEAEQAAYIMIDSVGQKPYSLRQPVGGDTN